jgi:hypothetical protein
MPLADLRAVIVGAGIGGPCLAQGLRQAGVEVAAEPGMLAGHDTVSAPDALSPSLT